MYMLAVSLFMLFGMINSFKQVSELDEIIDIENRHKTIKKIMRDAMFGTFIPGIMVSSPVLYVMYDVLSEKNTLQSHSEGHIFDPVAFVAIGSFILFVQACFALISHLRKGGVFPVRLIFWIQIMVAASIIAGISAYQHFSFAGGKPGIMPTEYAETISPDINCNANIILVSWHEGQTTPAEWRCPTSVIFPTLQEHPFIPWPSYTEGESQKLTDALNYMFKEAKSFKAGAENTKK